MKLASNPNSLDTTIQKAADFGIEDSDLSHIMGILRSQIYSDKLLAVIREYSTNAVDANAEAGIPSTPIEVHLPTNARPTLSFTDQGNGLTDDEVCSLYVKYGASTKRNSNDYTGCLGIGCKAAFAYGDAFTIISTTIETTTTWLARIDESKRGTISKLSETPNILNKQTGVTIEVEIRKDDIDECVNKARKFFKYWQVRPKCNMELTKLDIQLKSKNWAITSDNNNSQSYYRRHELSKSVIVMGNIAYPMPENIIADKPLLADVISCSNVILYAQLGSLDIAANREALEITDRTKAGITALAVNMLNDLTQTMTNSVASESTRIKASIKAQQYTKLLGTSINNRIASNCTWHNLPLIRSIDFHANVEKHYKHSSWRSSEYKNRKEQEVRSTQLTEHVHLCMATEDLAKTSITRRIRTLQEAKNNNNADVFFVINEHDIANVEPRLEPADYTDLSNIDPLPAKRTTITKTDDATSTVKQVRINVCTLKPNSMKSARLSDDIVSPDEPFNGKFVYVPLNRFSWDGREDHCPLENLGTIKSVLKYLNYDCTIYGVKKHHVKKLDNSWITLDQHIKNAVLAWKIDNPKLFNIALEGYNRNNVLYKYTWPTADRIPKLTSNKDLIRLAKLMSYAQNGKYHNNTHDNIMWLYLEVFKLDKQDDTIPQQIEDMTDILPLLRCLDHNGYTEPAALTTQHIKQYIKTYLN